MAAALVVSAGVAGAATAPASTPTTTDDGLVKAIRHEIRMYPQYTIWDDVSFRVSDGAVVLSGAVSQPYKKDDMARLVQHIRGVGAVQNEIKVLPVSFQDDRLRLRVARAIYGDTSMTPYAVQPLPPIHIIVENGHVRLEGMVASAMDKEIAGIRASTAGLSFGQVINNLQVESPSVRKS